VKKIYFYSERLSYFKRHFSTFFPHITIRKIINLLLNEIEMNLRITTPKSLPPYIKIEPTPQCQLRCEGCAQRNPDFRKQFNNHMQLSIDDLTKIIDPISDTLLGVSLSLYGEPMLNRNLISLIEYIHSKNVAVSFPTNFSIKFNKEQAERMVLSGLDCIYVSLDGASQETYSKYRVGGNFELVLRNVELLSNAKKEFRSKHPIIVWKFVNFEHNKHEIEVVKGSYKTLGFDSYELVTDFFGSVNLEAEKEYKKNIIKNKKVCYWPWNTMIIRWDGSTSPCCPFGTDEFNLGNSIKINTKEVWSSPEYDSLRRGFIRKDYGQKMHPFCKICLGLSESNRLSTTSGKS
jgi:MoaA/NifB/PqqE/SkfB family radical SAM enzyme